MTIHNPWMEWLEDRLKKKIPDESGNNKAPEKETILSDKTIGDYRQMLDQLIGCRFVSASYDKRFVRNMHGCNDVQPLTVKQAAFIDSVYHRYRRQIPNHQKLCKICGEKTHEQSDN